MLKVETTLVIVPTYNEVENLWGICEAIYAQLPDAHILVVDDNSTDGTKAVIAKLEATNSARFFCVARVGKLGLGTAYIAGFQWALARSYAVVIQMDADFSHPPERLPALLKGLSHADVAIGSRYIKGGAVANWGVLRRCISRFGSIYARAILGLRIRDLTGGFNAWKRSTLAALPLQNVRSEGYSFQIELKYRANRAGLTLVEIPISFTDRRAGHSKMSSAIVWEAMYRVFQIRWFID